MESNNLQWFDLKYEILIKNINNFIIKTAELPVKPLYVIFFNINKPSSIHE